MGGSQGRERPQDWGIAPMTNDQNDQEGATLRTTTPGNGLVNGHPAEAGELDYGGPAMEI